MARRLTPHVDLHERRFEQYLVRIITINRWMFAKRINYAGNIHAHRQELLGMISVIPFTKILRNAS
ncbi:MAG: hypothetical protein CM15mP8_1020 [Methanobacteriota archaeon]|nr:MAG: hypothetical protein CM15mP8_1020 [Euryarchaeota archaeon]